MSEQDWEAGYAKSLGVFLNGDCIPTLDARGEATKDDSFIVLFNAHFEPIDFTVPTLWGERWSVVLDTSEPLPPDATTASGLKTVKAGEPNAVEARSLTVLRRET